MPGNHIVLTHRAFACCAAQCPRAAGALLLQAPLAALDVFAAGTIGARLWDARGAPLSASGGGGGVPRFVDPAVLSSVYLGLEYECPLGQCGQA